jgi:hypothetical protein
MKVIYGDKFTQDECLAYIPSLHFNIIQGMEVLVHYVEIFGLVNQLQHKSSYLKIRKEENKELAPELVQDIKNLWHDPVLQLVWNRRNEFQVIDSVAYYLDEIDRIMSPNYIPTEQDIFNIRIRTSGIVCESYNIDHNLFEMYDVGGQRNERKKWIHCFEGVTGVIFVAALSEFDQVLFEDKAHNRLVSFHFWTSTATLTCTCNIPHLMMM